MFITQPKEIMEACPTARLDAKDAQRLIRSIEEEEEHLLEPLLGEPLMLHLYTQYTQYIGTYGGITTDKVNLLSAEHATDTVLQRTIPLLRDIQSALVYRMFANKIYVISTSLNLGGGANRASAGDYDPADDKHLKELRQEFWMNSIHACDNILTKLEKDARTPQPPLGGDNTDVSSDVPSADNPENCLPIEGAGGSGSLWYTLWRDSDGFFMKEDTLFPTMRELKQFYPCDQPTRFLNLQPLLLYCQNTYVIPRVNEVNPDLMDILLDPSHPLTDEERKAKKLLRVALSYHMQAHQAPKSSGKNATPFNSNPGIYSITPDKTELIQSADSALSTALSYISRHLPYSLQPPVGGENPGVSHENCLPLAFDLSQNAGDGGSASCNTIPGHESHTPCQSEHHHPADHQCAGRVQSSDGDYSTFCSLFPSGLNRW